MCGIVGYIGSRDATPIIVNGLKKLEYRGYDSAGVAVYHDDQLEVRRAGLRELEPRRADDADGLQARADRLAGGGGREDG